MDSDCFDFLTHSLTYAGSRPVLLTAVVASLGLVHSNETAAGGRRNLLGVDSRAKVIAYALQHGLV